VVKIRKDISSYHAWLVEIGLLFVAFAFGIFGLDRSPTVWYDETLFNELPYQLAYHGKFISSLEPGLAFRDQAHLGPPIHPVFQAVIFRILGFGIWQVRLSGLFFHLLGVLTLFLAGKLYFNNRIAGLVSSALFLFDPAIVKSWRSGRPDAMAIFLGLFALLILLYVLRSTSMHGRTSIVLYIISGVAMGLACSTHPNCLSFAVSGIIFLVLGLKTWKKRITAMLLYSIGGVLGMALWIVRVLTYPHIFAQQFLSLSASVVGISGLLVGLISQAQYLVGYYKLFPLLLGVQIGGIIWGFKTLDSRRKTQDARLRRSIGLWVYGSSLASCWSLLFYFTVIRTSHPLPYVVPIMILGAGGLAIFYMSKLSKARAMSRTILILLAFLILANGLSVLTLRAFATIWQWEGRSHSALVREWREKIPSGAKVAAPPGCWYAALANKNPCRYNKILSGGGDPRDYRTRIVEDNVEYLVLQANADLHNYLLDKHVNLLQYVNSIRRPMRHLIGIEVGEYNFDIYRRK